MKEQSFPTAEDAMLYLNHFHEGKHLDRLKFLAEYRPEWVMGVASRMWNHRLDGPVGCGEGEESRHDFYADMLDWAIPDVYTRTLGGATDSNL